MSKKKSVSKVYEEEDKSLLDYGFLDNMDDQYYIKTNALFDLNKLNVAQLVENVQSSIDKKPSRFLIFRNRENKKIQLETAKVQYLIENVSSLRSLGNEMLKLQADAILTAKTLSYLVNNQRRKFQMEFELSVEQHYTALHSEKTKRKLLDSHVWEKQSEEDKKQAEIDFLDALTEEQRANANFMQKMTESLDTMSDEVKAYMFHSFITRNKNHQQNSPDYKDFNMDEFLRDMMKEKMNEDLKAKKYENISNKAKAQFEKWKHEQRMKDEV